MTGKPMDRRRRKVRIPIGIEKVLCAAAGDREFREQLLMARADALEGTALDISPSEALILRSVSEDALRTMIDNIDLKRHRRRRFFRGIAAASLAATTALGTTECAESFSMGVEPDFDTAPLSDLAGIGPSDVLDVQDNLTDLGATDSPLDENSEPTDVIEVEEGASDIVGSIDSEPDEIAPGDIQDVDVDEMVVYAGIPPQDVTAVDVDIQPMPAGIPPMDVTEE